MENQYDKGVENFRPRDNSIKTSLRYHIEAEKQLEAYSIAYTKRFRRRSEDAAIFNLIGSLLKGTYYLFVGIIYLLFKKKKKVSNEKN